jgi:hypothetical protein
LAPTDTEVEVPLLAEPVPANSPIANSPLNPFPSIDIIPPPMPTDQLSEEEDETMMTDLQENFGKRISLGSNTSAEGYVPPPEAQNPEECIK